MNELERMVSDGAARLFRDQCSDADMERLERGEFPAGLWAAFAGTGFELLLCEREGHGSEAPAAALQLAMLSGYNRVPLPVREVLIARAILDRAGLNQPEGLVVAGQLVAPVVADGREARLSGDVRLVPWARHADWIVVVAGAVGEERVCLINARAAGVVREHHSNIAAEPRDDLQLIQTACEAVAPLAGAASLLQILNSQLTAASMTGAAEAALDLSVQYAKDRVQFGQPIGRFQAVQQALAIAAAEVTSARAACGLAFQVTPPLMRTAAVAKIRAGTAASVVANVAHQVHGAIGITQEYSLHFLTRRLWAWRAEDGTDASWAQKLGRLVIERGAANCWADVTSTALGGAAPSRD